jgi:enoyl-CoA hydratase
MGGGMGLSVHGTFVVVSPEASFAMPETKIGFFPDVGGSHFLPRLPGHTGRYLGLTGARITAADALSLGLATHACSAADLARLPGLIAAYDGPLEQLLRELAPAEPGSAGDLASVRPELEWVFSAPDLAGIGPRLARLVSDGGPASAWARQTLAALEAASPYSLAVTDRLLVEGRGRSLEQCLQAELVTAAEMIRSADFVEGVRAVLVDKDHAPRWSSPVSD